MNKTDTADANVAKREERDEKLWLVGNTSEDRERLFSDMFDGVYRRVYAMLARELGDAGADDCAQAVFVQVWQEWEAGRRWPHAKALQAHVLKKAGRKLRNRNKSEVKRQRTAVRIDEDDTKTGNEGDAEHRLASRGPSAAEIVLGNEMRDVILATAARMPVKRQRAFMLWFEHELSFDEVASEIGTKWRAARWLIDESLDQLLDALNKYEDKPKRRRVPRHRGLE